MNTTTCVSRVQLVCDELELAPEQETSLLVVCATQIKDWEHDMARGASLWHSSIVHASAGFRPPFAASAARHLEAPLSRGLTSVCCTEAKEFVCC